MNKIFPALLVALLLTGAGCFQGTTQEPAMEKVDNSAPVDVEAETPDLSEDSSAEEVEAVVDDLDEIAEELADIAASLDELNSIESDLE